MGDLPETYDEYCARMRRAFSAEELETIADVARTDPHDGQQEPPC